MLRLPLGSDGEDRIEPGFPGRLVEGRRLPHGDQRGRAVEEPGPARGPSRRRRREGEEHAGEGGETVARGDCRPGALDHDGATLARRGAGGNDAIDGGAGNDRVFGNDGNDFAVGGAGDDNVFLGAGDDLYGSDEEDRYDAGNDFVRGGAGDDIILDVRGSNELFGDLGNDVLLAADGLGDETFSEPNEFGTTDTLSGGLGDDTLAGDDGDEMTGGEGEDEFVAITDVSRPQQSAVEITDFDPAEDVLTILLTEPAVEGSEIEFVFDADAEAVNAIYEGRTVAVLRGLDDSALASLPAATAITAPETPFPTS